MEPEAAAAAPPPPPASTLYDAFANANVADFYFPFGAAPAVSCRRVEAVF
jgi:hypothetical protein